MPTTKTKACQNCKDSFTIDAQDFAFYEKIKVPAPTFCWRCRAQRRLAWRNERYLSRRKSDFTEEEIFSMYPAVSPVKVYEIEHWVSDKWDPMQYGKEIDFSKPFLVQLRELLRDVPVYNRSVLRDTNSPYSSNFTGFKNCYLCFNGDDTEDSMYSTGIDFSKRCVDVSQASFVENSYDCFAVGKAARNFGCVSCGYSYDMYFSKSCIGCNDCIGCVNLKNKKYHIFNQPYSKEEYEAKLKEFNLGSYSGYQKLKERARQFWLTHPNKFLEGIKYDSVSGAYIGMSKNVQQSYFIINGEDLKYCQYVVIGKNSFCYDYTIWGDNSSFVYESVVVGAGINNLKFSSECWPEVRDSEYAFYCQSSVNLFGCAGLKNKQYCILNKQYRKEEYESLVPKIIEHMNAMPYADTQGRVYAYGEFLPIEFSPFPYNYTMAQEQFPLTKETAVAQGFFWHDPEERGYTPTKSWKDLPDHIADVPDQIVNEIILCEAWDKDSGEALRHNCAKAFRILPQELEFYRYFSLPIPRKCPNTRHAERLRNRLPLRFWESACQCAGVNSEQGGFKNASNHSHGSEHCPNKFETAYPPERPEIVYCEVCYNAEVA